MSDADMIEEAEKIVEVERALTAQTLHWECPSLGEPKTMCGRVRQAPSDVWCTTDLAQVNCERCLVKLKARGLL